MARNQPRIASRSFSTIVTQQLIMREIIVPTDQAIQIAPDLGQTAMIGTFMLQNVIQNNFPVYLTTEPVPDPSQFLPPFVEIVVGASPVFQIAQRSAETAVVWDLSGFWLIGDDQFVGQTAVITLTAFPLPVG